MTASEMLTIPSAISPAEADALEALARRRSVLEIGAQFGFSTVLMANVATEVVSIDWHRGDPHAGFVDSLWTYRENLRRHGIVNVITVIGAAADALRHVGRQPFELVFHDASHDYQSVKDDLLLAAPLATEYLAIHDYGRFDGLTTACREVMGEDPSQVVDTLAIYRL